VIVVFQGLKGKAIIGGQKIKGEITGAGSLATSSTVNGQ